MSVLDILLSKKLISKADLGEVRKQTAAGAVLDDALIAHGVKPDDIVAARGEFLNIPVRSLEGITVPFEILEYIPEESALHYRFAPIGLVEDTLEVGIVDPDNMEARDALSFLATKKNIPYNVFLITVEDFNKVIEMYKGLTGEVTRALSELETELSIETTTVAKKPGP